MDMLEKGTEASRAYWKGGDMTRNSEGHNLMVVDIAIEKEMDVLNTYFKKSEEHRGTYTSCLK